MKGMTHTTDKLPKAGKYVLGYYEGDNWMDSTDPFGCKFVVVTMVKGLSLKKRKKLKKKGKKRANTYKYGDQGGNNKEAYAWETFGPSTFFGQQIKWWCELPHHQPLTK